jgi:aromatic ring-cleaving dioxygenase
MHAFSLAEQVVLWLLLTPSGLDLCVDPATTQDHSSP